MVPPHLQVPADWAGKRVRLCFGAVNWDSIVWVNGKKLGTHRGGYDGFEFDITESLQASENELVVAAWNPVLADVADAQVLGKQRLKPGGIFYTPSTGIWQTVWLEPVPDAHVTGLKIVPDVDAGVLRLTVSAAGSGGACPSRRSRSIGAGKSPRRLASRTPNYG